ncbi:MAG: site-specific integrase [Clostridia bacterium]|nr:site-specific integrase [Clostridia bacterium]
MASIYKRKGKFSVVYRAPDENGEIKQRWETFNTMAEAKARQKTVESLLLTNSLIVPNARTVRELLDEYVTVYGLKTWAPSTYEGCKGLIDNYIVPIIGKIKIADVNTRMMNKYYDDLLKVKAKETRYHHSKSEFVTPSTVRNIHKLLRSAFNQAVKWELLDHNPVINCTIPKKAEKEREVWDIDTLTKALDCCTDPILFLAINLAFSCSLRVGELLGLTWDCIDISQDSIDNNRAYIYINKELQRVSKSTLEKLGSDEMIYRFPAIYPKNTTVLILKPPKTKTSVRKVYLPKTVANLLVERKAELEELSEIFGDEFTDYNLVMCHPSGRPMEGQVITNAFRKLIDDNGLPRVVFHSLRHTSTTYKLRLSGGDIKAVQGDTGHSQATMVTDRYAHIMDDDRRINTEKLEHDFYKGQNSNSDNESANSSSDAIELVKALEKSPELMNMLKALLNK